MKEIDRRGCHLASVLALALVVGGHRIRREQIVAALELDAVSGEIKQNAVALVQLPDEGLPLVDDGGAARLLARTQQH